jgi:hypothetical protein
MSETLPIDEAISFSPRSVDRLLIFEGSRLKHEA